MGLVLFYAKLGWVAGPGRIDVTYEYSFTPVTGLMLLDTALPGRVGRLSQRVVAPGAAGLAAGLFLAGLHQPHDTLLHAQRAGQEYVIAARAKGLSETRIIWRHALRNAMVPLVTVIALSYAGLLEGSVLTETVFAWPGLGLYITNSLQNADMNAVLGGTIVVGSVFIGLNLLSDLLYRLLDPRTRRDEHAPCTAQSGACTPG
jgi:peptide/nickel transport system permease protein